MASGDRQLDRMIVRLQHMPPESRVQILERLSPSERAQLERLVRPPVDSEECLSPWLAALIETLRDGPTSHLTDRARDALLVAAAAVGSGGAAHAFDTLALRPTLVNRMSVALGGRQP